MSASDWTMSHIEYDAGASPGFRTGCIGTFHVTENEPPRPAWAECDECGDLITVPQQLLNRPVAEPLAEWSH